MSENSNREPVFKTRVLYTRPRAEIYGAKLFQVPQNIDDINFIDIEYGHPLSKKPRTISFTKFRVSRDRMSRTDILEAIKRLTLRPATFHEFTAFLQLYPDLKQLRSLACFGSHGKSIKRVVLAALVYENRHQNLYLCDTSDLWNRGAYILCVLEEH